MPNVLPFGLIQAQRSICFISNKTKVSSPKSDCTPTRKNTDTKTNTDTRNDTALPVWNNTALCVALVYLGLLASHATFTIAYFHTCTVLLKPVNTEVKKYSSLYIPGWPPPEVNSLGKTSYRTKKHKLAMSMVTYNTVLPSQLCYCRLRSRYWRKQHCEPEWAMLAHWEHNTNSR